MARLVGALIACTAMGLSILTGPATAVGDQVPPPAAAVEPLNFKRDFLPACATPTSMNCIESIEYLVDDEWKVGILRVGRWIVSDDGNGNIVYGDPYYEYETPGLVHEAGRTSVNAMLIERDDVNGPPYAAYQFVIQSWPQDADLLWDPPINRCDKGNPSRPGNDPCWRAPWLADTDYRFTFRTSTLEPIFARSSAMGLTTSVESIRGGLRVAVTGRPGPSQFWTDRTSDRAAAITYEWEGFVADARARNGVLAACKGLGIATAYSNGNGGFMPEWNAQTGTLEYGITGMHYGPDGKVYRGQAEVRIPGALARCMWKVDPRQVSRMEIEVFGDDGGEVAGTKTVGYEAKADLVKLIAIDFTYSEKQIVARPTPVKAQVGKKACNPAKTMCVTVDRSRKSAKVTLTKVKGTSEVFGVALRGTREDGGTQASAPVRGGKASLTLKLSGKKAKDQVWVLRSNSTFISSFQVG